MAEGGGYNLGTAWIQVAISNKDVAAEIRKQLENIDTARAERNIVGRLGGAFSKVGKIAAGAFAAVGSVAVAAGFSSIAAEAIEASDATNKFKSTLKFAGKSAEDIDRLTKSTKDYADKTVYGLSDIQSITSQLAANNVEGYDRLAEAAGNLNAVAGGNADTFQSVGMVLTQTAGQGKLTTENFNQLSQAISGASGLLQESLRNAGAYTGDFRDAMAKGEITAEEFNAAILELGFTDAASEAATSTATIEGAWGQLQAALVTGGMELIDRYKPAITEFLNNIAVGAESAFKWIQDSLIPGIEGIASILFNGDFTGPIFGFEEDSGMVDFLFNVRDAAIAAGTWVKDTLLPNLKSLFDILVLGDFTGPIFGFEEDSGMVDFLFGARDAAIGAGQALLDFGGWVVDNRDWITSLVVAAAPAVTLLWSWHTAAKAVAAVQNAGGLLKWVKATNLAKTAQAAFNVVANANPIFLIATALIAAVAGLTYFFTQTETGKRIWGEITAAFKEFLEWIGPYWDATLNWLSETWNTVWGAVSGFFNDWVVQPISAAITTLSGWWDTLASGASTAWDGLKSAVSAVVDWFGTYVLPVFEAVWTGIKIGAWIVLTIMALVFKAIQAVVGVVVDWFSTHVAPVLSAVWDAIKAGAGILWDWMKSVWDGIMVAVALVVDWFQTHVQPVIESVWEAIKAGVKLLYQQMMTVWVGIQVAVALVVTWFQNHVQPILDSVWNAIKAGAKYLWDKIKETWDGIKATVNIVVGWFQTHVQPVIESVWNSIKSGANNLWTSITDIWNGIKSSINSVLDWMKSSLQSGVDTVTSGIKSAFQTMKDGIQTIWDGVKGVAAKPINFIIGTVYTDGIKKTADSIAEKLGLSLRLPSVSKIPGYSSGGVLPGYTPGRDIYHFTSLDGGGSLALSGGESIMVPEWTKAVGGKRAVAAMNAAARYGRSLPLGDAGYHQRFADGGVWEKLAGTVSGGISSVTEWISSAADAVASIVSDPLGAVTNLIKKPVDLLMANLPGTGFFTDMARDLPGRWIDGFAEWLKGQAPAISASDLVSQARLAIGTPYVWGGVSVPGGLDCSGLIVWALRQMGHNVPRHTAATFQANSTPVGSPIPGDLAFWGYPAHHVAIVSGSGMMVEAPTFGLNVREVPIYGGPSYGRFKYDQGGLLQPGLTLVENATGKPEPVFTSSQWDKINSGIGLPRTVILKPKDDREFEAYLEEVADSRIVVASQEG
ncbi:tape measure protein [Actinomyces bowdenii]|uniref:tape measure protein n=1 Tax=Actinomyces bowdenii TaxID=131109 RepID=UPI00214C43B1|nr:tape measure protein [Actinomyces bowdenii]MCR2051448.1 tape measure protein [Actinomyces bowdenii]